MSDELLTTVLAVWGALLSTAAIAWNIGRDVTDRARLHVTCYFARLVGGPGPPDERVKLAYTVTNAGRRPAVISNIGGALRKPTEFVINCRGPLPRTFNPVSTSWNTSTTLPTSSRSRHCGQSTPLASVGRFRATSCAG